MTGAVERVCLTHLRVPLKEPVSVAGRDVGVKDAIVVLLESSQGAGIGECSPIACEAERSALVDDCWNELTQRLAPDVLGRDFSSLEEIEELCATWPGGRCAVAGVETACWDLLAQARHAPLAELLGASDEQLDLKIESGLSLGRYATVVELLKAIETHLEEGYRRVKIEIEPGSDLELVRAVRRQFGDIPLMVDAQASYTAADLDVFRELDEFDLLMFEQPMAADDLDGLAALQEAVITPVCLDESAGSLEQTAEAIRRGACRIVSLKLQRLGGFGPALALHDLCYERGVACWVGTMPELGIGQAQGIHLAALGNCRYPTDIEPSARWFVDDVVVPRLELAAPGVFRVPTRPGLGYQLDPVKLKRYQVRQEEFTLKTVA
jgi:O-succinylbenzoate synthase